MRGPPVLSEGQLETLAENGEERPAEAGEVLFEVGDKSYPFIAILEGEVEVQDPPAGGSSATARRASWAR